MRTPVPLNDEWRLDHGRKSFLAGVGYFSAGCTFSGGAGIGDVRVGRAMRDPAAKPSSTPRLLRSGHRRDVISLRPGWKAMAQGVHRPDRGPTDGNAWAGMGWIAVRTAHSSSRRLGYS